MSEERRYDGAEVFLGDNHGLVHAIVTENLPEVQQDDNPIAVVRFYFEEGNEMMKWFRAWNVRGRSVSGYLVFKVHNMSVRGLDAELASFTRLAGGYSVAIVTMRKYEVTGIVNWLLG